MKHLAICTARRALFGFAAASLGTTAIPVTAVAQQGEGLDEVVVTARRYSENSQSVPISMTAITAQDLQDLSMRDVRDMQRIVPGLYISSFPASGRAKLTIRGQNETDDKLTADRAVGVYIDGVSFEHQYGLTSSLVDIAQVETLRGPQGTLFGRNTTGGALNITTQRPTYELGGYIDALYGSEDNVQLLGVLNAPIVDDRLAVRIVGQSVSRDGYFKEFDGHESGDDDTVNGRIHLRADPMDNVRILLSADIIRVRNTDAHLVLTNDSMLAAGNTARGALGAIASQLGLNPSSTSDRLAAYDAWREIYDAYQSNPKQGFGNAYEPTDELDNNGAGATIEVDFGSMTAKSITGYRHLSASTVWTWMPRPSTCCSRANPRPAISSVRSYSCWPSMARGWTGRWEPFITVRPAPSLRPPILSTM